MREKLIELLKSADDLPVVETYESFADYLIDNGMTIPVHCKDCKHWDVGYRFCKFHGLDCYGNSCFGENGFCSYGERKNNEL